MNSFTERLILPQQFPNEVIEYKGPYDLIKNQEWAFGTCDAEKDNLKNDFKKEEDGYWYRQPHVHKNIAGVNKSDLISRSYAQEIISWLENAGM